MEQGSESGSAWRWVYDLDDRTPQGSLAALESTLGESSGEPLILYFEAADPQWPTDERGWCPDCKVNTKQLYDFVLSEAYRASPVSLFRVIASWERSDWKDAGGLPNMANVFRDPARPWRLAGLPTAVLAVGVEGEGHKVVDGVLNPDARGLEYLRSRARDAATLPTERMLC
jgi:hypothetical protein